MFHILSIQLSSSFQFLLFFVQIASDLGPPHLRLSRLEMGGHDVGEALNEGWITVGGGTSRYSLCSHLLADVLSILDVQLVQSLDVVVDEGDGDQHQVLLSSLAQNLDGVLGARL